MVSYRTLKEHAAAWGAVGCLRHQPSRTTGTAPRATAKTRSKKLHFLQCTVFLQIPLQPSQGHVDCCHTHIQSPGTKNSMQAVACDKRATEAATAAALAAAEAMADLASPGAQQQTTPQPPAGSDHCVAGWPPRSRYGAGTLDGAGACAGRAGCWEPMAPGSSFCWGPELQGSTSPSSWSSAPEQAGQDQREVRRAPPPTPTPARAPAIPPAPRTDPAPSRRLAPPTRRLARVACTPTRSPM